MYVECSTTSTLSKCYYWYFHNAINGLFGLAKRVEYNHRYSPILMLSSVQNLNS